MKYLHYTALALIALVCLNSCTIETSKKKDGFKIEITANDDLIIDGEKINDKKLDREIKKLIRDLEKEGLTKAEIRKAIDTGRVSVKEAVEELKKELEEVRAQAKDRRKNH
jgi:transcriptional regulator